MQTSLPRLRIRATHLPTVPPSFVDCTQQNSPVSDSVSDPSADRQGGLGTTCEIRGQTRQDRYALQNVARSVLMGQASPKGKAYRLLNCQRATGHDAKGVDLLQGPKGSRFGNLQTCGSVWTCAFCAAKIMRHREGEIQQAMDAHRKAGGRCVMVTLTHSHRRTDKLAPMVDGYAKAARSMKSYRAFKAIRKGIGYVGEIRALEVTWGDASGFHPHGHELWFIEGDQTMEQLEALRLAVFDQWAKACERAGLPAPSQKHGVDVSVAWSAAEYMAKFSRDQKWGAGKELTRAHSKRAGAKGERYTPFDFLRAIEVGHRPAQMTELFREYAHAYHGRRQLHWSSGLKDRFGIDDVSDEEAVEESEAAHTVAGTISLFDWRERVMKQGRDCRSAILEIHERDGMEAVHRFIAALPIGGRFTKEKPS